MTPDPVLTECLERLVAGEDLSRDLVERAVGVMMDGEASEVQVAAFLTALRAKGVTATPAALRVCAQAPSEPRRGQEAPPSASTTSVAIPVR